MCTSYFRPSYNDLLSVTKLSASFFSTSTYPCDFYLPGTGFSVLALSIAFLYRTRKRNVPILDPLPPG